MKYKDNEISYSKAKKISKKPIKTKKLRKKDYSSIDTIYLDKKEYYPTIFEKRYLKNIKNMIIDTNKIKIINKDKTDKLEPNSIYIQDTNASNIYFINELNLGGITYTANSNDVNIRIHFSVFVLSKIKEVNIVSFNGKVNNIKLPHDTKDIIITSVRKHSGIIETMVEIKALLNNGAELNKSYYISEFGNMKMVHKNRYTSEDIKDGILDLTDLKKYTDIRSDYLKADTLIINKKDIFSSKFKTTFSHNLNIKTLRILEDNNMKLNPTKEIEINGFLWIYKDHLINEAKNKLIYLDKNNEIKVLDKEEILNNEDVEKVDFLIQLIIIKNKDNTYKIIDKDSEYKIDDIFNHFLYLNRNRYDFSYKEIEELVMFLKNNDYYNIFNEGIIDNNLLSIIYQDYIEFLKYISELKTIGFTDKAISYLLNKKYENIINTKSNNLIDMNKISQDEIELFNKLGEKEIKKKLIKK